MKAYRSKLIATENPTAEEKERGAEIIFVRKSPDGTADRILACRCYESWEQWGAHREILSDNCKDVEAWRRNLTKV